MTTALHDIIKNIQLLICDVDGVMTDGSLFFSESGEIFKSFHAQDGLGIKLLLRSNIKIAVISGRQSPIVEQRLTQLGIAHIYLGYANKIPCYEKLLEQLNMPEKAIAYVGDDLPDLPIMQRVGLSIAVANANPTVAAQAMWQTQAHGGRGAIREICDLFLQVNDCLSQCMESLSHDESK